MAEVGMTFKRYTQLTSYEQLSEQCKDKLPKIRKYIEDIYEMCESDEDAEQNADSISKSAFAAHKLINQLLENDE